MCSPDMPCTSSVCRYIDAGKDKELTRCEDDLERKDAEIKNLDGQIAALEEAIRGVAEALSRKQLEEREIRDNLKLRELQEEVRVSKKAVRACDMVAVMARWCRRSMMV